MYFTDRREAGKQLAHALQRFGGDGVVVQALPRGGVVPGAEIAKELEAPLGLVLVRKLGHPYNPEFAIGAIAEGDKAIYDPHEKVALNQTWRRQAEAEAQAVMTKRRKQYFDEDYHPPEIRGKTVIIVDDGIATGLTMQAAVKAVRNHKPKRIIVAVPVASEESVDTLVELADEVIVLDDPRLFLGSVGAHYRQFEQVDDETVGLLLAESVEQQ